MSNIKEFKVSGERYGLDLQAIGSYLGNQLLKDYIDSQSGGSGGKQAVYFDETKKGGAEYIAELNAVKDDLLDGNFEDKVVKYDFYYTADGTDIKPIYRVWKGDDGTETGYVAFAVFYGNLGTKCLLISEDTGGFEMWGEKQAVLTVNGNEPDSEGNVTVSGGGGAETIYLQDVDGEEAINYTTEYNKLKTAYTNGGYSAIASGYNVKIRFKDEISEVQAWVDVLLTPDVIYDSDSEQFLFDTIVRASWNDTNIYQYRFGLNSEGSFYTHSITKIWSSIQ